MYSARQCTITMELVGLGSLFRGTKQKILSMNPFSQLSWKASSARLCSDPEPQKSCPHRCPWCPWCPGSSLGMIKSTQTDCLHRQLRGRSDSQWHGRKGGEDEDQGTNDQTWNPIKHYNNTSTHHFTTTNKDNNSSSNSSSNKKKKKQWQWHEDDNHWPQRQW